MPDTEQKLTSYAHKIAFMRLSLEISNVHIKGIRNELGDFDIDLERSHFQCQM